MMIVSIYDGILKFGEHVRYERFKIARQPGLISKMRHNIPRSVLLKYYFCNVKPTVQNSILVHGCTSFTVVETFPSMQKNTSVKLF